MISQTIQIAREAGQLLRENFGRTLEINQVESHDIKLQLDLDCQRLIESKIHQAFPDHSIVGEEEDSGNPDSEYRWIVDPLDGTVNYTYGIPHFCVSIALQHANLAGRFASEFGGYESIVGVVYDPMRDELFSAEKGKGAFLNGNPLHVSKRSLEESIITVGFSKTEETMQMGMAQFQRLICQVRKMRTMGAAALDLAYVAGARMDAYLEFRVRLWDIAAGILMVEEAGGLVRLKPLNGLANTFKVLATNGKVDLGVEL